MANLPRSEPIHLRPSFSATASVVPEPQKKSATMSFSLEDGFDDAFEQGFGFLGGIIKTLISHGLTIIFSIIPNSWTGF